MKHRLTDRSADDRDMGESLSAFTVFVAPVTEVMEVLGIRVFDRSAQRSDFDLHTFQGSRHGEHKCAYVTADV